MMLKMKVSLMSMIKIKKFEFCRDFVLIDKEVNNKELKILSTHSNKVSIQEYL